MRVKGSLLAPVKIRKRKPVVEANEGGREELDLIQAEDLVETSEAPVWLHEGAQVKKKRRKKKRGSVEVEELAASPPGLLASQAPDIRDPSASPAGLLASQPSEAGDPGAATGEHTGPETKDGKLGDGPLKGMKKWLAEYHAKRPGADVLQRQIDGFILDYDARQAKARADREAAAAVDGWTLVVNKGGKKKTTDAYSGITVGAVSSAAVVGKAAKKQKKADITLDFYRFQKREQHRTKILELQQKFENDKKRLARLKAARKFTPY